MRNFETRASFSTQSVWEFQQISLLAGKGGSRDLLPPYELRPESRYQLDDYSMEVMSMGRAAESYGGYSFVLRGYDSYLNRPVVLKVLLPGAASDSTQVQDFVYEAQVTARLPKSPYFPRVHDITVLRGSNDQELMALVLEPLEKLDATYSRETKTRYLADYARGLDRLHASGWIHADVKERNMMIRRPAVGGENEEEGTGVLIDYSGSIPMNYDGYERSTIGMTKSHIDPVLLAQLERRQFRVPKGIPPYQDRRDMRFIDQYAFAVATAGLLGQVTLPLRALHDPLEKQRCIVAQVPQHLRAPLERALHPDWRERFATCEALMDEVSALETRALEVTPGLNSSI